MPETEIKEIKESQELLGKTVGDLRKKLDTFIEKNPKLDTSDFVKSSVYKGFIERVEVQQKKFDEAIKEAKLKAAMTPATDQEADKRKTMFANLRGKCIMATGDPNLGHYGIEEKTMNMDYGFQIKAANAVNNFERAGATVKPPEVLAEIVDLNKLEISKIRPLATVQRTTFADTELITQTAHGNAFYTSELATRTKDESDMYGLIKVPVHELYAYSHVTHKLLQDANFNFEAHVTKDFAMGMAKKENQKFVNGNGIDEPLGFMHSSIALPTVNSGTNGVIEADTLKKVWYTPKNDYMANPSWLMNRATTYEISILKDGIGGYIFQSAPEGGLFSIMGSPIVNVQDMPDVATDAYPIAFGDWKAGLLIKDLVGSDIFIRDIYSQKATGIVELMWSRRNGSQPIVLESLVKYKTSA